MATHIMIDLETLGTRHNAVILSIGAVKFDPGIPADIQDRFHVAVDPSSCQNFGLEIDASTVMWWLHADRDMAREKLLGHLRFDLPTALEGFALWFGQESMPVWGNGATFDNMILRSAYEATHIPCPWKYWHDRCFRTVKNMVPAIAQLHLGVLHDAANDAASQALHLQVLVRHLGLEI